MDNNFEYDFDLFANSDDDPKSNKSSDNADISSNESDVLDLNSYFTIEDDEQVQTKPSSETKKEGFWPNLLSKFKQMKFWRTVIALFLVCVMVGCIGAGALIGYVKLFIDGTMEENLNSLTLDYSTTIYAQNENGEWVEYQRLHGEQNRIWVDYDRPKAQNKDEDYEGIPQYLADAFVAIEDKRFFDHEGVDWRRTIGAFVNMVTKRTTSGYGGSSITQQLVKNLTKDSDRSAERKLREIMRARYLESKYAKETILECYMNTVAMGNGLYGVEVAAEYYYGKNVNELTLAQCASLAGITNLPESYRPDTNPYSNKKRRDLVLDLMHTQKLITTEEYEAAVAGVTPSSLQQ